jgi:phosphopantothenoylcysteine decarboxylase/phosphopantothenate--cysteine ligase
MANPLSDKKILLGVTGSIACYKAADLASKLAQAGALVDVVLTGAALQFITPLTFQSVTGRRAYVDADLWGSEGHVLHIELGKSADLVAIAPASANTIAKLATGIADNLLTVTALAAGGRENPACTLLVAPAMDGGMYSHPATQANLALLRARGALIIGPAEGHLASGLSGVGRMVEPAEILGRIRLALAQHGPLKGRKVVVTAGGTAEPVDPVRVLSNRSSGKQGYALAQAALDRGAQVVLISGPTALATPAGAERLDVETAEQMCAAVLKAIEGADALLMAAAVADFRPAARKTEKIKRGKGVPRLDLEATPDILLAAREYKDRHGWPRLMVGFAAESQDLLRNAQAKLQSKGLDLIVANDIRAGDAGFSVDNNRVTILDAGGGEEELPLLSKVEVANVVLERVQGMLD